LCGFGLTYLFLMLKGLRVKIMSTSNKIHISVRNLVELVLRSGSIDSRYISSVRAVEGTRIHQKLQKARKKIAKLNNYEYISEVKLNYIFDYEHFTFEVEGRADGIVTNGSYIAIEEIKSTMRNLDNIEQDSNPLHWAQAKCYAYIYALQNKLTEISVELVYCQADTQEQKIFTRKFDIGELEVYFYTLIQSYILWAQMMSDWAKLRDGTIKDLDFPYEEYRKGQRQLAVCVYKTIQQKKKLFAQAPTGTGKTISTLFPVIKAMAEGETSKIFYLTARTITRQTAEDAFYNMKQKGLRFKVTTITAKDKICFCKEGSCTPEGCQYANGHFDRVNEAILDILECEDLLNRQAVEKYAQKHTVCPFEFSLDLTLWSDCIIGDYNYAFDPKVYLKRFFEEEAENDYVFLIDEAHNLVDRAREMFSASINKKTFLNIKKQIKDKKMNKCIKKLNTYMLSVMKTLTNDEMATITKEQPEEFYMYLREFTHIADEWLAKNEQDENHTNILELYFEVIDFLRISEFYDDRYVTYMQHNEHDLIIKLFCLDPSYLLSEAEKRSKASIFFSATLTPLTYFRQILGGKEEDFFIKLPSPFEHKNLDLLIAGNISTRWKNRQSSYEKIVEYLYVFSTAQKGNYFAFFPSYHYMNTVYELFIDKYPDITTILQDNSMNEEQRENYLLQFEKQKDKTVLGFAVMGGIFSEGIDLIGDRLIGAAIIGVGLPQISLERDIIAEYYKNTLGMGYEYSYMYPGMNKVMQSAGRVIRTQSDRGVVMLIDERFLYNDYVDLFPDEWQAYKKIYNKDTLETELNKFWYQNKERI
jgi:DNA excision repair protein ERCC-2